MTDILLSLAINFFKIGTFSIGGGYAIITLIEDLLVNQYHWLTLKEYTDIITISQLTPGPLAINSSSFVGLKIGGFIGAVIATISCTISGFIISLGGYIFFCCHRSNAVIMSVLHGLKSVATGLIGSAGAGILLLSITGHNELSTDSSKFDIWALSIAAVSLFLLRQYKINSVWLLALSATIGILIY